MAVPLAKLEQQVKCPVCLDVFRQPKLLACSHALCKDCIDHIPVDKEELIHKVKCPTCREYTTLPCQDAANLPPAFHINTLVELWQATQRAGVTVPTVPVQPKSVPDKCPKHKRPLEMFCEDCQVAVCLKCERIDHRDHNCEYLDQKEINDHLEMVKRQASIIVDAVNDLNTREKEINIHGESVKKEIDSLVQEMAEAVQQCGRRLKESVDKLVQQKTTKIQKQKEEGELALAQLQSCRSYVEERVKKGSMEEDIEEKEELIGRLKEASQQFEAVDLASKERTDIRFVPSSDIVHKYSKIGEVSIDEEVHNKVVARAHSVVASSGDTSTCSQSTSAVVARPSPCTLHNIPHAVRSTRVAVVGKARSIDVSVSSLECSSSLSCSLVGGGMVVPCKVDRIEDGKCPIRFTPTHKGIFRIKLQDGDIDGCCEPSSVKVIASPETSYTVAKRIIGKVYVPYGITITNSDMILVTENTNKRISVLNKAGDIVTRIPHKGGSGLYGICTTHDGSIIAVSCCSPDITKYSSDYSYVTSVGSYGTGPLQFHSADGIAVTSTGLVCVCDGGNHRVQVLNPDLTFSHMFGSKGSAPGQFMRPQGIAVDSLDTLYVCDYGNGRIQKFTSSGTYMGEIRCGYSCPWYIAIDSSAILYVTYTYNVGYIDMFDVDGECLGRVMIPDAKLCGIAVDDQGQVYVCDHGGNKIVFISVN